MPWLSECCFLSSSFCKVSHGVSQSHIFFHAERGNAAAAAFDGAFGENIADCHAEDDNDKNAESKEEGFHVCIPEG